MLRRHPAPRPLLLVALAAVAAVMTVAHLGAAAAATSNVTIGDNTFTAPSITITAGDSVVWTDNGVRPHTVTADDGSFDSGNLSTGQTFSRTFTTPGTIRYYCKIHGAAGGLGMSGTIIVQAQATTTTTATPTTTTVAATTTTAPGGTATTTAGADTTTTTAAAVVSAAGATRASAAGSTQADATSAAGTPPAAAPAALASTGVGPYTAALAAIGLALVLTGIVVVRRTRFPAAHRGPEPPSP